MFSTRHDSFEDLIRNCRSEATTLAECAEMLHNLTGVIVEPRLLNRLSDRQIAVYIDRRRPSEDGEVKTYLQYVGEVYW